MPKTSGKTFIVAVSINEIEDGAVGGFRVSFVRTVAARIVRTKPRADRLRKRKTPSEPIQRRRRKSLLYQHLLVAGAGLELGGVSPGDSLNLAQSAGGSAAQSGADSQNACPLLAELVGLWPGLNDGQRATVLNAAKKAAARPG